MNDEPSIRVQSCPECQKTEHIISSNEQQSPLVIDKTSASKSIILPVFYNDANYYLKVGYEIRDYGNNSLSTEKYIYDSVVPGMVRQGPAFISGKRLSTKETATIMATIRSISAKDVTIRMDGRMLTITDALLGQRMAVISELATTKAKRKSIGKMVNEVIILTERKCCKGTTTLQEHNQSHS